MKRNLLLIILFSILLSCNKSVDSNAAFSGNGAGQGGSLARFTLIGNYLYTVDKQNLKVFDITNPALPVFKRTIGVGFEIETIFPFKNRLFVGSSSKIYIFSIDDPANPQKLSEAISETVMRRCDPVVAKDTVAYATLRANGSCGGTASVLAVYDIRNVAQPVEKSRLFVTEPYGLGYTGNVLYVCDRYSGIVVFNISQAYSPVQIRMVAAPSGQYFIDLIPYNDVLVCWSTNGMVLYDISNPQNPVLIKTIN